MLGSMRGGRGVDVLPTVKRYTRMSHACAQAIVCDCTHLTDFTALEEPLQYVQATLLSYDQVCVCACVRHRTHAHIYTHTHTHTGTGRS
jgi:hypothetical protein